VSAKSAAAKLLISERALRDIAGIEEYSVSKWGKRAAAKYVSEFEAALVRMQQTPELLRLEESFHPRLSFYRVNKHLLVCDMQPKTIVLLTVIHVSRDIPSRLAELAPTLATEVELLHQRLTRERCL
jgi:plasmid stabilization system protein ParE